MTGAQANPLIFLSAGEASGERYGAALMEEIRRRLPEARFFGLGGAAMAALGFRPVVRAEDVAHMGITEVVRHAPYIYGQFQRLPGRRAIQTLAGSNPYSSAYSSRELPGKANSASGCPTNSAATPRSR